MFEQPSTLIFWTVGSVTHTALVNNVQENKKVTLQLSAPCTIWRKDVVKYVCVWGFLLLRALIRIATHHTMWNHMKKTKTKNKEAFAPHKSSTTLFAMMDYITGLTGMSIMDIWWSSEWMGTVESRVISHYVLKTCYVLENSLRWEWNGEERSWNVAFLSLLLRTTQSWDWATHTSHLSLKTSEKEKQKSSLHGFLCFDLWKFLSDFYPSRWHAY